MFNKVYCKVKYYNSRYYVFDEGFDNLYVFDSKGNYLHKIGKRGRGPGEYIDIADFELDTLKIQVLLFSAEENVILKYDTTGVFVSKVKLPVSATKFAVMGGNKFGVYTSYTDDENYNLHILKSNGEIYLSRFKFPYNTFPFDLTGVSGSISACNSGVLYTDASSTKIFNISQYGDVSLKYSVNLGVNVWPYENRFDTRGFFKELNHGRVGYLGSSFFETSNILAFTYVLPLSTTIKSLLKRKAFFNLHTHNILSQEQFLGDLFLNLISEPMGVSGNGTFISIIQPYRLIELRNNNSKTHVDKLDGFTEKVKKGDNPIICTYKFKQF